MKEGCETKGKGEVPMALTLADKVSPTKIQANNDLHRMASLYWR